MNHDHSAHDAAHHGSSACCHGGEAQEVREPHRHSSFKLAVHATAHCLTGCMIGEFIGLAIGVSLGLHPFASMTLATVLAFISGFSLTVFPLMRKTSLTFGGAMKAVWLGEVVSIGVMEIVMNSVDYHMGGVRSGSVFNPKFWEALAFAVPAGYLAALPINAWLLSKQLKRCH